MRRRRLRVIDIAPSFMPCRTAISEMLSVYQYRLIKILLFSGERLSRNVSMAFVSSFWSNACPTSSLPDTRSESSSKTTGNSPPPRLSAVLCLYRLNDKLRTIYQRNVDRMLGLCGGMEFHAFKYVSFTHSSASSLLPNMLLAIEVQYLPYLSAVAGIACSFLSQYNWTIFASSISVHLTFRFTLSPIYTTFELKSHIFFQIFFYPIIPQCSTIWA